MKRFVYADNSATTKISKTVLDSMMPYLTDEFGNASSLYSMGGKARLAVDTAREQIANAIGASAREIYFTSGGSEADNWAIKGTAKAMLKEGKKHIITSKFEHHAVLHTLSSLERDGFEITYVDVNENGIVNPCDVEKAIREDTGLVTIMYANNEIGTIQPIKEIGAICRKHGIPFHTDAVQAVGNVPINVNEQNIDMLSMSAHKFHGPKGVGALYLRRGTVVHTLINGGAQEFGRRAGTENTAGVVGMGVAIEEAVKTMESRNENNRKIRDYIIENALKIPRSRVNGDMEHRLSGNVNMCFEGIEGESLLLMLDYNGIQASSGSACTSGSLDPSHVLLSIGLPHEIAHGSLRLSFGDGNTMEDAEYIMSVLPDIIARLRAMSPLWDSIKENEKNVH
ncbi:MAG: cysteine desulfurase NifS [Clostridia bacterium]|nr:cysteine desulfurase NifS [Clostridia bacterium]